MAWTPMQPGTLNPELIAALGRIGEAGAEQMEAWSNDLYQCVARHQPGPDGTLTWLSIKRHDRHAIRNWRHLQQIKNEVCGPLREAVEIFPSEDRLVDAANETHLWVLPENVRLPFGFQDGLVSTDDDVASFNAGREAGAHRGRQDAWEDGLTTGRNEHSRYPTEEQRDALRKQGLL